MNFGDIDNISLTADFLLRIVQLAIEAGFLKSNSSGNGTAVSCMIVVTEPCKG